MANEKNKTGCLRYLSAAILAAALALPAALPATAQQNSTNLQPLPRFVSLRADKVNMRTGPGQRYPIDWVLTRNGLPVEVIAEFENWRQVRVQDSTVGWVHRAMLSGSRTVAIQGTGGRLYRDPAATSPVAAAVEDGVIGELLECDAAWCRIGIASHGVAGWITRDRLWGVYPGEKFP